MQKIREQVLVRRDKVYQDNEGEVRKRWHFEDAVSSGFLSLFLSSSRAFPPSTIHSLSPYFFGNSKPRHDSKVIFQALSESRA